MLAKAMALIFLAILLVLASMEVGRQVDARRSRQARPEPLAAGAEAVVVDQVDEAVEAEEANLLQEVSPRKIHPRAPRKEAFPPSSHESRQSSSEKLTRSGCSSTSLQGSKEQQGDKIISLLPVILLLPMAIWIVATLARVKPGTPAAHYPDHFPGHHL